MRLAPNSVEALRGRQLCDVCCAGSITSLQRMCNVAAHKRMSWYPTFLSVSVQAYARRMSEICQNDSSVCPNYARQLLLLLLLLPPNFGSTCWALVCTIMSAPVWEYLAKQTSLTMSATVWRSLSEYLLEHAHCKFWNLCKNLMFVVDGRVTCFSWLT